MRELLAITKALADENRLRALALLAKRELCLCQLIEVLGLAPSSVSRHMTILYQARLVEVRKSGRWSFFRLAEEKSVNEVQAALSLVLASLQRDPQGKSDQQKLRQVLKIEPEELCRRQTECKC